MVAGEQLISHKTQKAISLLNPMDGEKFAISFSSYECRNGSNNTGVLIAELMFPGITVSVSVVLALYNLE